MLTNCVLTHFGLRHKKPPVMRFFLGFQSQQKIKYSLRKSLDLVHSKSLFFVEKSYINNKFIEIKIRLSNVEKINYLRCLYREDDTGNIRGTSTLTGGLGFTALNYSHSIVPDEIIEW